MNGNQDYALEENSNCERTNASFRIVGESLDPRVITPKLGIVPSYSHPSGHKKWLKNGQVVKYRNGVWLLSSEDRVVSTSIERHLIYLLERLEPRKSEILEFVNCPSFDVDFSCTWVSSTGHGGPVLSSDLLIRLSSLCNLLSFDFYGPDGELYIMEPEESPTRNIQKT